MIKKHVDTITRMLLMTDAEVLVTLKRMFPDALTDGDNYVYVKHDSPFCFVAHIDTVRFGKDKPMLLEIKHNVIRNANGVLGADDRAGVWGLIQLYQWAKDQGAPLPSLLFTNYEECGGLGVGAFIKSGQLDTANLKLFVELDRRGANEWVTYSGTLPKQVKSYIEAFGFTESTGSYSDIANLITATGIPGVNLSCGYYAQHTSAECLHVDELLMTVRRCTQMISSPIEALHKQDSWAFDDYGDWGYSGKKSWRDKAPAGDAGLRRDKCSACGEYVRKTELIGGICELCFGKGYTISGDSTYEMLMDAFEFLTVNEQAEAITAAHEFQESFPVTDVGHACPECGDAWEDCTCGCILAALSAADYSQLLGVAYEFARGGTALMENIEYLMTAPMEAKK